MNKLAVDVSNYTGALKPKTLADLQTWHIKHLMAGTQVPSIANEQIWQAKAQGWEHDIYVYLDPHATRTLIDVMTDADYAVEDCPEFFETVMPSRIYLDCEWERNGMTNSAVCQYIQDAKLAALRVGFRRIGIYTRKTWWEDMASTSNLFTTLPLWYSSPGAPNLRPFDWREQGFGGWWKPAWRQYALDELVHGQKLDFSVASS